LLACNGADFIDKNDPAICCPFRRSVSCSNYNQEDYEKRDNGGRGERFITPTSVRCEARSVPGLQDFIKLRNWDKGMGHHEIPLSMQIPTIKKVKRVKPELMEKLLTLSCPRPAFTVVAFTFYERKPLKEPLPHHDAVARKN